MHNDPMHKVGATSGNPVEPTMHSLEYLSLQSPSVSNHPESQPSKMNTDQPTDSPSSIKFKQKDVTDQPNRHHISITSLNVLNQPNIALTSTPAPTDNISVPSTLSPGPHNNNSQQNPNPLQSFDPINPPVYSTPLFNQTTPTDSTLDIDTYLPTIDTEYNT